MARQDVNKQMMTYTQISDCLEDLCKDLQNRMERYAGYVRSLEAEGMDVKVASRYKSEFWKANNGAMQQLITSIKSRDIPYMKKCIEGAQAALSNYSE